jgi:hypothetical protein
MSARLRNAWDAAATLFSKSAALRTFLGVATEVAALAAIVKTSATAEIADSAPAAVLGVECDGQEMVAEETWMDKYTATLELTKPRPGSNESDDFGDAMDWETVCDEVLAVARGAVDFECDSCTVIDGPIREPAGEDGLEFMRVAIAMQLEALHS